MSVLFKHCLQNRQCVASGMFRGFGDFSAGCSPDLSTNFVSYVASLVWTGFDGEFLSIESNAH